MIDPGPIKIRLEHSYCTYCRGILKRNAQKPQQSYHTKCQTQVHQFSEERSKTRLGLHELEDVLRTIIPVVVEMGTKRYFEAKFAEYRKVAAWIQQGKIRGLDMAGSAYTLHPKTAEYCLEILYKFSNLKILYLNGNYYQTLPESLGQLIHLQELDVSGNQLTKLPQSVGQLTNLQELWLSGNRLTTLPQSIGQLTRLHSLNVYRNQLTKLPPSVGQLANLEYLNASRNQLLSLPESMKQLNKLRKLDLRGNVQLGDKANLYETRDAIEDLFQNL